MMKIGRENKVVVEGRDEMSCDRRMPMIMTDATLMKMPLLEKQSRQLTFACILTLLFLPRLRNMF